MKETVRMSTTSKRRFVLYMFHKTGISDGDQVVVLSGITGDGRVVIRGAEKLKEK